MASPSEPPQPSFFNQAFDNARNYFNALPAPDKDAGIYKVKPQSGAAACSSAASKPASIEETANHSQSAQVGQNFPLSGERVVSSIPRGEGTTGGCPVDHSQMASNDGCPVNHNSPSSSSTDPSSPAPHHQLHPTTNAPISKDKWAYPSEQQYYNAITRKGWRGVEPSAVPSIVAIHNAVNEEGWRQCRLWEEVSTVKEMHNGMGPYFEKVKDSNQPVAPQPRLVKFEGRPGVMSPKSFLNHYLLGYGLPFDRHDWYVERVTPDPAGGEVPKTEQIRYVVEFYTGGKEKDSGLTQAASSSGSAVNMYLDVRPAIDSPFRALERVRMSIFETFPGIFIGEEGGPATHGRGGLKKN
jgi:cytochrome c heme-lyase